MANNAEELAQELLFPIFGYALMIVLFLKFLEWILKTIILPHAIPILWTLGMLLALGIICFVCFKRAGNNREACKSLILSVCCAVAFGGVVYFGYDDKLLWACKIVDSTSWVIEHPVIAGVCIVVMLILAVTIPIPGLGPVRRKARK